VAPPCAGEGGAGERGEGWEAEEGVAEDVVGERLDRGLRRRGRVRLVVALAS
jgi:hypothetical protein